MTDQQNSRIQPATDLEAPKYIGIGGWLWLFVIIHMYIAPLFALLLQLTWWVMPGLGMSIGTPGDAYFPAVLRSVVFVGLVIYGFVAAWRLNGLRRGAVRFVKTYLIVAVVASVISAVFLMESRAYDAPPFTQDVLWSAIWFAYFSVSKRVKATYPEAGEGSSRPVA